MGKSFVNDGFSIDMFDLPEGSRSGPEYTRILQHLLTSRT